MSGQRYGWQDCLGGVEPGFADVRATQASMPPPRQEPEERGASTAPGPGAQDDAQWLQPATD